MFSHRKVNGRIKTIEKIREVAQKSITNWRTNVCGGCDVSGGAGGEGISKLIQYEPTEAFEFGKIRCLD